MKRLEGKTALITGATKGIGKVTAELFVSEGAKVILCGRNENDGIALETALNSKASDMAAFCKLDVTDRKSWEKAIAFAKEKFGELNILINNAGISFRENLGEISDETWDKTVATNQTGVYYGMQLGIAAIAENGKPGAIVSTASVDGVVGDSDFFGYCATKAAVQAMTRCAALYCGEQGFNIRVNAVAPGYILTEMAEEDARQNGQTMDEYCREFTKAHPIGRIGQPIEVAEAYLFLASDAASFTTGTTLMVDGGYVAK
ncbi:glucose 1-dehydrogenase [Anaerovorax odorimutans]|uniref:Glucose 1-dehydrogenase n=1 Tax=Anaerovorax odorimutans TaxID=109327 RepID=A0ABT1RPT8_9FIRM|nr:glucose 1-dehydrogenase [Anaerovorax odorimutans]MCQ4637207.1 glucose 1-dehydrogenase [Anaerovorax odorimutans]